MTRPFLAPAPALAAAALTACGSAPPNASNATGGNTPMVFASTRSPQAIARCLTSRLPRVDEHAGAGYTELGVGHSSSGYAWLVTLTSSNSGSNVRVEKAIDDDSVSEPALRFAIARCTV